MRRVSSAFLLLAIAAAALAGRVQGQMPLVAQTAGARAAEGPPQNAISDGPVGPLDHQVDGIAVRIEDDVLTESELRELAAFQQLVDGKSKDRSDLIRELTDQWIVRTEADAAKYPRPSEGDIDRAVTQLEKQFASPGEFAKRCAAAELSQTAVRRQLELQLYLSRFIDYRFRPDAQVSDEQIQSYYDKEFAPQLAARKEAIPALDDVEDTIREVLIQREINARAQQWLDESRERLPINVLGDGS